MCLDSPRKLGLNSGPGPKCICLSKKQNELEENKLDSRSAARLRANPGSPDHRQCGGVGELAGHGQIDHSGSRARIAPSCDNGARSKGSADKTADWQIPEDNSPSLAGLSCGSPCARGDWELAVAFGYDEENLGSVIGGRRMTLIGVPGAPFGGRLPIRVEPKWITSVCSPRV